MSKYGSYLNYLFPCAAILEKHHISFKILNINFMEKSNIGTLLSLLDKLKCTIIGITTNATNIYQVSSLCRLIKLKRSDIRVVLGGPQCSFDDIRVIKDSYCDVVIRHEGDIKLVKVIKHFQKGIPLSKVKGITYREGDNIFRNQTERTWLDINLLPTPQYAIVNNPKYWVLPPSKSQQEIDVFFSEIMASNNYFMASRGCPYRCTFCVEGIIPNNYRERSPELVYKDLLYFLKIFKAPVVFMADSTLTSSVQRVRDICNIFRKIRCKKRIWWYAEGRVNVLSKNLFLIKEMKDAGLLNLQIGIETGNDKIMDIIHKGINKEQIKAVASEVGRLGGMLLVGNIIIGLPGETSKTFHESLCFAKELQDLSDCSMLIASSYFVPFIGTEIRRNFSTYPMTLLMKDFEYEEINGFEGPICTPVSIPIEDFELYKPLFDMQIKQYVTRKILTSSKTDIDKKMEFVMRTVIDGISLANHWYTVIFKNILFQRYYFYKSQQDTTMPPTIKELSITYPVRLWDLDFDYSINGYHFTSIRGEDVKLTGELKDYWEYASGKLSIQAICERLFKNDSDLHNQINHLCGFYKMMYDSFGLMFKKVPSLK
ncbi:MAG: B12-binding domain-containing radical SAM protein [Bacteroidales bacterium]|nr:B12-binding domain-containing radical SAM protein [Bacteroidales bacterium]